jgi:hypothetical protein
VWLDGAEGVCAGKRYPEDHGATDECDRQHSFDIGSRRSGEGRASRACDASAATA